MEVFHQSMPLFTSQVNFVFRIWEIQQLRQWHWFYGFIQANNHKDIVAYATTAGPITSLATYIDTTDEEHSCDSDNSKSNVSMDEVSYLFVWTVPNFFFKINFFICQISNELKFGRLLTIIMEVQIYLGLEASFASCFSVCFHCYDVSFFMLLKL